MTGIDRATAITKAAMDRRRSTRISIVRDSATDTIADSARGDIGNSLLATRY